MSSWAPGIRSGIRRRGALYGLNPRRRVQGLPLGFEFDLHDRSKIQAIGNYRGEAFGADVDHCAEGDRFPMRATKSALATKTR